MSTEQDFRRIAMSLDGTTSAPHFDRTAFKGCAHTRHAGAGWLGRRPALAPEEQECKCLLAPDALRPMPNPWAWRGWTAAQLAALSSAELENALRLAWRHAVPLQRSRAKR
jgi:hypothetical protein